MYRYELHCHENIASLCGVWTPAEMVKAYASWGYAGIVVTDHLFNGNCAVDYRLPWKEKVEKFCLGYELAKKAGADYDLDVFFGFEYSVNSSYGTVAGENPYAVEGRRRDSNIGCDFLIYGLDKEWLLKKDERILTLPVNDFMQMVRKEGGTVVQAHPFRFAKSYMNHISLFPEYTDGVEIFNGNPNTIGRGNRLAKAYAEEYGFFAMAGSDAHGPVENLAVTVLEKRVSTIEELIQVLREGRAKVFLEKNRNINWL